MGQKHRPFYRIVVSKSTSPRDSASIEYIGTYNPVAKPTAVTLKNERALHWLMSGAQPTETVAYILKKQGVLDEFFAQRPKAKGKFSFLDKRTAAMSQESVIAAPVEEKKAKKEEAPVAVAEAPVEAAVEAAPAAEVAAEEVVADAPVAEAPAEETPAVESTEAPAEATE